MAVAAVRKNNAAELSAVSIGSPDGGIELGQVLQQISEEAADEKVITPGGEYPLVRF